MRKILITGGAGYIGSHVCAALADAGFATVILDNFSNSRPDVADRIEKACGRRPFVIEGDVRDAGLLDSLFAQQDVCAVMHFAGLKSVSESVGQPLEYYDNNFTGTLQLLGAMRRAGVRSLVFSSSAAVYGEAGEVPIREDAALSATNPYGRSKLFVEQMLVDLCQAEPEWRIACLRYFNPVGAHESGLIGEEPSGTPNNLMPIILDVASGHRSHFCIFGNDYPTPDGTGVRDYVHVMDLAEGHVAALRYLEGHRGFFAANLGTGRGYSVLEILTAFERICGIGIPKKFESRRVGDAARCWADPAKARESLAWSAKRGLDEMCRDAWRWKQFCNSFRL